jgi:hypothetical protein
MKGKSMSGLLVPANTLNSGLVGPDGQTLIPASAEIPDATEQPSFPVSDPDAPFENTLQGLVESMAKEQSNHLEMFAAAFMKTAPPGLQPQDAQLVQMQHGNTIRWFFMPTNVPHVPRDQYLALLGICEHLAKFGGRSTAASAARGLLPVLKGNLDATNQMMAETQAKMTEAQAAAAQASDPIGDKITNDLRGMVEGR